MVLQVGKLSGPERSRLRALVPLSRSLPSRVLYFEHHWLLFKAMPPSMLQEPLVRPCLDETGPVVPGGDLALGAVAGFGQTCEGKGARGSGLCRMSMGRGDGAPSRLPAPLPIRSEHPGAPIATCELRRDADAGVLSSSAEMKLSVQACPGRGGLV